MANSSVVLSSWKEIAAYLGKGVRAAQRWERDLELPVRRPVEHNQRIVIALPAELDAWIHGRMPHSAIVEGRQNPEHLRADSRAYRAKLVALRAELGKQRDVIRRQVDSLRSRCQKYAVS